LSKDLFSNQSATYAKYRPGYPEALIRYILSFVTEKKNAWDCATGNGQAAVLLANYFNQVEATDLSAKQLEHAIRRPNIRYGAGPAEKTSFPDNHFDLITIAQAYHWFRFDDFGKEAVRVAKNDAVVAVWGYRLIESSDKILNGQIAAFYSEKMGPYWDAERKFVDQEYETIPFPFEGAVKSRFNIFVDYTLDDLVGYLNSWSSVQHFIKEHKINPVDAFRAGIEPLWQGNDKKSFYFPLFVRLGKIKK
jgi:Methyltransferase domain